MPSHPTPQNVKKSLFSSPHALVNGLFHIELRTPSPIANIHVLNGPYLRDNLYHKTRRYSLTCSASAAILEIRASEERSAVIWDQLEDIMVGVFRKKRRVKKRKWRDGNEGVAHNKTVGRDGGAKNGDGKVTWTLLTLDATLLTLDTSSSKIRLPQLPVSAAE
ncbi:hypothetical protein CC78DRAFT_578726 [Lojkania enalia]|uniref:Uncharacterized protein n=1 Tax=Lojkania enalia TaxID=147567 RepID=A0A9P4N5A6_9PLEO|nr:hypothetical protein CC78DRAFT_578726 [Didymosphaeria enalia]